MDMDMIAFRSITPAQRAEQLLRRNGIASRLQRTPRSMAQGGCGYCLTLRSQSGARAMKLLAQAGIVGTMVTLPREEDK